MNRRSAAKAGCAVIPAALRAAARPVREAGDVALLAIAGLLPCLAYLGVGLLLVVLKISLGAVSGSKALVVSAIYSLQVCLSAIIVLVGSGSEPAAGSTQRRHR